MSKKEKKSKNSEHLLPKSVQIKRKEKTREVKVSFLIVCQGEKTEKHYFNSFKLATADVKTVDKSKDPLKVVREALKLKSDFINEKGEDSQIWCVFDKDQFTVNNIQKAFILAEENDIKIAYSNIAFEIWFLFHFNIYTSPMSVKDLISKLNVQYKKYGIPKVYDKNDSETYNVINKYYKKALKHAKMKLPKGIANPKQTNPSTSVHLLVEELNNYR